MVRPQPEEVVQCVTGMVARARERMGLADSQTGDTEAADRILDSWREHRQRYPQVSGR